MKSKTPITDDAETEIQGDMVVYSEVARELELKLAALESGQPTEVGGEKWQLVPVKPTTEMLCEMNSFALCTGPIEEGYAAMLTASASERKV